MSNIALLHCINLLTIVFANMAI